MIQRVVDAFAKGLGMVKESGSWYRHADSLVTILNLQKSQYAPRYYLNIAFWLMGLGSEGFPKENTAHVRIRLDVLLPEAADEITKLFGKLKAAAPQAAVRMNKLARRRLKDYALVDGR